jgi:malonyl CoA-acyl carrier protein transacylase/phosphopantetheinyl transferase/acyl carrier protein
VPPDPTSRPERRWSRKSEAVVIEASSREELVRRAEEVRALLASPAPPGLADLAATLNTALEGHPARLAVVAVSPSDLERKLAYALGRLGDRGCRQIKDRKGIYYFAEPLGAAARLALLFPGEGAQYPDMLADLCLHLPVVRESFDRTDRAFAGHPRGYVPSDFIFARPRGAADREAQERRLWEMDGAVEAVFTANHALHRLLEALGIRPYAVVGHSTGEYSALIAAGCIDVSSDEQLTRLMLDLNGTYEKMLRENGIPEATLVAVGAADREAVLAALDAEKDAVDVAMDNCPHQVVLCGGEEGVRRVTDRLRSQGAVCETLPFARAYHTRSFAPICATLREFFARVPIRSPQIDIYSCATAAPMPAAPDEIRALAVGQWAMPVRFRETVEAMYANGIRIFVEAGPRGNLSAFVDDTLRSRPHLTLPANLHRRSGMEQIDHLVALLSAHGVPLRPDLLYRDRACRRVALEPKGEPAPRPPVAPMHLPSSLPALRLVEAGRSRTATPPNASAPPTPLAGEGDGRSRVMSEYLRTAERFVQMQRGVMLAFLGSPAAVSPTLVASSAPAAGTSAVAGRAAALPLVAAAAGPPVVDAAGPLPLGTARDDDAAKPAAGPSAIAAPSAERTVGTARPDLKGTLLSVVSERTGYPTEMLGLELRIEADLGIDSIKRVEIVGALQRRLGSLPADAVEGMTRLKTLNEILQYLAEQAGATTRGPEPAPAAPPPEAPRGASVPAPGPGERLPLIGAVRSNTPSHELVTRREIDLGEDLYLRHHTLGSGVSEEDSELLALPLVMLTMGAEMLAQAAARLAPGKVVVELRDVRAQRWLALKTGRLSVEVAARRVSDGAAVEVAAELREVEVDTAEPPAPAPPALRATVVLADEYPAAPTAPPLPLRGARPSRFAPADLYTKVMFHGPSLQGVASVDRWGEDGAEATLRTLPPAELFRSWADPAFLTEPVLLDAAGQIVGFWTAEHLRSGFVVFPYRIDSVRFFGPALPPGERLTCRARIALEGDELVRSDFDVLGGDGHVRIRVSGWEDKRIGITEEFFRFRFSPRDVVLSRPWTPPLPGGARPSLVRGCRLEFAGGLLEREAMVWKEGLAHLVLSRREREEWRALAGGEKRRTEWLLGRLAAKDAARLLLSERLGRPVCPADVEVRTDVHGRPHVDGAWSALLDEPLAVSISHGAGLAVALAAAGAGIGIGIDVEPAVGRSAGFSGDLELAFTREERALLEALSGADPEEWLLRFWCAKEAASKALGLGMGGDPRSLSVHSVDARTGSLTVTPRGRLAERAGASDGVTIPVCTARDGAIIVAAAIGKEPIWIRRSQAPTEARSSRTS